MNRQMYSLVFHLATPLIMARLLLKAKKSPGYRNRVSERFFLCKTATQQLTALPAQPIWIHAVSVGEVIAAVPIVDHLLATYPDTPVVVTTTTPTGSDRVVSRWGDKVTHLYAPYDYAIAMRKFLQALKPKMLIIMETELWPNMIHYTKRSGAPIILANARLSAKSAKGYQRFGSLTESMLRQLSSVAAQAEEDGKRLVDLGLPRGRLAITGSVKFDIKVDENTLKAGKQLLRNLERPVWIAASTHDGEDELVLDAYKLAKAHIHDLLLILVPRHPERFSTVFELCRQRGWKTSRRSEHSLPTESDDLFIGDTMGELLLFYAMSNIAFVGGSLVPVGGHNVLEPIAVGIPVLVGPHMFNFQYIMNELNKKRAILSAQDSNQLANRVTNLLLDRQSATSQRKQASKVLEANQGAVSRLLDVIDGFL